MLFAMLQSEAEGGQFETIDDPESPRAEGKSPSGHESKNCHENGQAELDQADGEM
jgi:hypothetical protein